MKRYSVEYQQIVLRKLQLSDAERMLEWMNNPEVVQYMKIGQKKHTLDEIYQFIEVAQNDEINKHYAVSDEKGTYLGTVSLKGINWEEGLAEYAIALHPDAIGTGAAALATKSILNLAFCRENLKKVFLYVLAENTRAVRFYEKIGWIYMGSERIIFNGKYCEVKWFEMQNGWKVK